VVITLNEETNVERCLSGLSFADEIVVVDSFSTDRTVEIARRYTDKVSLREFLGFSDQKTAAMELASGEWVLFVDADEVVTERLGAEIRKAAQSEQFDGYWIPRSTWFLGKRIRHCGWYPDCQLRLARKSKARFPARLVHETLEVDGKCGRLRNDLVHHSYRSMDDYARKMVFYNRAAARQKMLEGRRFRPTDLAVIPGITFLKMYILKRGFMDGLHGFVLSVLSACSSALRYAMLWEMSSQRSVEKERPDVQ
jgi:glycosyltransferase involved in cell wall biosynthesis